MHCAVGELKYYSNVTMKCPDSLLSDKPSVLDLTLSHLNVSVLYLQVIAGLLVFVWPVVELSVQLSRVEVGEELLELAGHAHVRVLGEHVHVPEAVDGDEGQVLFLLAKVVQRVSELDPVGHKEIDVLCNNKKKHSFLVGL